MKIPLINLQDSLPMFQQTENSFTKFKIVKTGETFYYSNFDNGIYDENKQLKSLPAMFDPEYQRIISKTRSLKKNNSPYWIRILLGHACNYSCDYCLQKDIGNPTERSIIKSYENLVRSIKGLDLSKLEKIDLWGGETLLYWKTIVPIMRELDRDGLTWFIPTNGTTLLQKHIEFFSTLKGKVEIGISHDGPGHELLRGEEFLQKKIEVLKLINKYDNIHYSFNPTITNLNFDLFEINKFFYEFCSGAAIDYTKVNLNYNIVYNHDYENNHNSGEHVIHGDNLIKFNQIMKEYLQKNTEQFLNKINHGLLKNSLYTGGMGVLPYLQTLRQQILPTVTTSCGVDDSEVLSVDLQGNVRTCPHTDESFISGHITNLNDVRIKNIELDRYEKHCNTCPVYRLCKSTCPINVPDEVFVSNCRISKIWYSAIQIEAFDILFNSKVIVLTE